MDEAKLKEFKGKAQAKFDEISRLILDGENNFTHLLVKAYRHGHDKAKAEAAFAALAAVIEDARATYGAAIAQPEPKVGIKQRVVL